MKLLNDSTPPIVELIGVRKIYDPKKNFFSKNREKVTALDHIDLSIRKGEIFGLVGQSGSGKTTVGRLLVKLEDPTDGTLLFDGKSINSLKGNALKSYRSRIQMIFQDPYQSLNPHLAVSETILEPLIVHGFCNKTRARDKVIQTLETVGLSPGKAFYNRFPHQLSGGQRQRVAIARAIVLEPEFIVADEPTSMLDATIAIQLFQLLKKIRAAYNMTFLFITHNLGAAKYLCDRIAVIHEGKIVEVNTAERIIRAPRNPYTKRLIRAQPGFRSGHNTN